MAGLRQTSARAKKKAHGYLRTRTKPSQNNKGITMILPNPHWTGNYSPSDSKLVPIERPQRFKPIAYGAAK